MRFVRRQEEAKGVVLASGEVALIGATVSGGGGYYKPGDIESLVGSAGAEVATACADGPNGEVAVLTPGTRSLLSDGPISDRLRSVQ